MGCYNCKFLNYKDKKDGNCNGSIYYCSKINKYVNGADEGCDNYSKDYTRRTYESDEIYRNGCNYSNDSTPISTYLFIAIILIILTCIVNIF